MPEKFYLDTYVFMDILSTRPEFAEKAMKYLATVRSGTPAAISSALFAELAYHIARRGNEDAIEEIRFLIESLPNITVEEAHDDICVLAGKLRAKYRELTYFDCIHLATAVLTKCTQFVTGDRKFQGVEELRIELY